MVSLAVADRPVADDFSAGGWTRYRSTPGTMTAAAGKLHLVDGPEDPGWATVSKVFAVDFDQTPFFVVKVTELSDRGTVKLIRRTPHDKREAIRIDRPGVYAVDMRKQFGWSGTGEVETCLYAMGDQSEITYESVKFSASLTPDEQQAITGRAAAGNVRLRVTRFETVPLFNSCSYYFPCPARADLAVLFRREGGPWQKAYPPVYVPEDGMYRGSLVKLDEDTPYEVKVTGGGDQVLAHDEFRTWSSEVPVAETMVLDETNFSGRLKISRSGSPGGWLKITAKDGFVLRNDRSGPLIELSGATNILLEGLTLRGGLRQAISVNRCQQVRIVNCDIAGWGRIGRQRFDLDGKYYTPTGEAINWDAGILISRSVGTVVERCYIHDPVNTANSWYYSHPAGPEAVGIDRPRSTVLRYNDFIGSDERRWNDAVEGAGNFDVDGGFNRDADIYGNMMCFANDDSIELDGGQTNVRAYLNKCEGCLCGVSIQGCMSGPSYVFENLLVNMGDQRNRAGQTIKTSSNQSGPSAVSFLFNNTTFGPSSDLGLLRHLRIVALNNLFAARSNIGGRRESPQSECDYNLQANGTEGSEIHGLVGEPGFVDPDAGLFAPRDNSPAIGRGLALDNFAPGDHGRVDLGAIPLGSGRVLPMRPIPVFLDRYQVNFSAAETAAAASRTITATVQCNGFKSPYSVARNEAFDWFTVSPTSGVLESGRAQSFTVTLIPAKMTARSLYKGAFLIRLATGYSRPVTVYAATGFTPAVKPTREDIWTQYVEAEAPSGGKAYEVVADQAASGGKFLRFSGHAQKSPAEYRFRVPRKGKYFVLLRVKGEAPVASHDSVLFGLDDAPLERSQLRAAANWSWCLAAHNRSMSLICLESFDLTVGDHVLKLAPQESVDIDLLAFTDNPGLFD